ncbi:adenylyl-sulfate kinase [Saccharothrix isguenensis]
MVLGTDAPPGATVWLTGLPSAGKSTIAALVADGLRANGRRVEVLDGDQVRTSLCAGLGFSREDRETSVCRIGWVAHLLARNGTVVLVAAIAPYAASRAVVAARHRDDRTRFLEVHVATPVTVCSARDVKGLYARQAAGTLHGLTGVDDPYEEPLAPDLRVDAHRQSAERSAAAVLDLLRDERVL